jgi:lysozyme family protein
VNKLQVIDEIIAVEGGYVDDPSDSGGETNFGITVAVARASGYNGHMVSMPRAVAFSIYSAKYWDAVKADQLLELAPSIAEEVVDSGVNMGIGRAGKLLQRSLNVLNKRGGLYNDITVDGEIGPGTLTALAAYLATRDESTLLKALNCLQGAFYIELAERREKDERFIYGWLKNRVVI